MKREPRIHGKPTTANPEALRKHLDRLRAERMKDPAFVAWDKLVRQNSDSAAATTTAKPAAPKRAAAKPTPKTAVVPKPAVADDDISLDTLLRDLSAIKHRIADEERF